MEYDFFLSSMMGLTDGTFCAQRSSGCKMVQLGAYLAEPTANSSDMGNEASSFLPASQLACTEFLAQQCREARKLNNVKVCLNLATPRLEWGIEAAQCFKRAGGDYLELNVHGGYQRYLAMGKLRAMVLAKNQNELFMWVDALCKLDIPLIVKLNGQYDRPLVLQVIERLNTYDLFGIHINVRHPTQQPDYELTQQVRDLYVGYLLVSGNVRSGSDAYSLFAAGADMVGIAEPTIKAPGYIKSCLKEIGVDRTQCV
ncbi:MAG: hypothetical protein P1S60_13685 [Anaerolineae bacterium]|nr:hypothetical protein [Anaerolineae bacterium]